jgi:hypothetical protein
MKNPQFSKSRIKIFNPVMKNNWIIKFSIFENNILLIVFSMITDQCIVRYFDNEDGAVAYINYILMQDANKIL